MASPVSTEAPLSMAVAAIQTSFTGIGVPARRSAAAIRPDQEPTNRSRALPIVNGLLTGAAHAGARSHQRY